ncbi:ATP-dependent RNA helicase RhlB [Rhabdochromatium marinum]|uniref:ATP-dependent RNA helicase RhlB n=1 Tax=Rhabdochromatium marinum TaxID=48729 RepID=UPI001908FA6C|nr:ATP-dependent RNA helicase RhlB [Rhabdochromatium marinum]MBK1650326.1 ATP-dependent RNA helicase RhlB [Rhabdochromatium marinum]
MSETHLTETRFDSFALDSRILDGLNQAGFTFCTPIQAQALPIALAGHDVAGQAQTGTGKTAAYLVAALHHLLRHPPDPEPPPRGPQVLILAPTRELAVQIHKDALLLAQSTGFRLGLAYGGTGYQQQRDQIASGVDILIGTPGRLIDYFKQHVFDLKSISVVILDEADRMFDLGFIKDIRFILRRMPPPERRLGMLFSATLSYRVTELAYEHMNDPTMVEITPEQVTADRVTQCCYMVGNDEKIPLLIGLLHTIDDGRVMVFINTKRQAERVWGYLQGNGIKSAVLSGDVPQKQRLSLLRRFQEGELPVLVATDVAARGLHIPDVSHVINFDLPDDPQDYVHRIGRTARAGAAGDAISFACETYAFCLPEIESYIGAKIPVGELSSTLLAEIDPSSRVRAPRREPGGRPARGAPRHKQDSRHKNRPAPRAQPAPMPQEAQAPQNAQSAQPTTPPADKPKRRRRRRAKPRTDNPTSTPGPTAPDAGS